MYKGATIFGIFLLFCLIIFFCISDHYMRGAIILGVIGTVAVVWWHMSGGDR